MKKKMFKALLILGFINNLLISLNLVILLPEIQHILIILKVNNKIEKINGLT